MLKKLLIAVVAVAVGLTVVKSTKVGSLMRVKWNEATAWCNKQIPVPDEIASLRLQIANLGKAPRATARSSPRRWSRSIT
jgi:hypothetical protein